MPLTTNLLELKRTPHRKLAAKQLPMSSLAQILAGTFSQRPYPLSYHGVRLHGQQSTHIPAGHPRRARSFPAPMLPLGLGVKSNSLSYRLFICQGCVFAMAAIFRRHR